MTVMENQTDIYAVTFQARTTDGWGEPVERTVALHENYSTFASIPKILAVFWFSDPSMVDHIRIVSAVRL